MTQESAVQVAPDSSGKRVRTLEATVLQPDGTLATVEIQVVALADRNGQVIDLDSLSLLGGILRELEAIRQHMELYE